LGRGREPGLYRAIADKRDLEPFVRATVVAGLDIIAGSRELGHRDIRSTLGYAELQETQVRAALERPALR
jgi:hypothetical protein